MWCENFLIGLAPACHSQIRSRVLAGVNYQLSRLSWESPKNMAEARWQTCYSFWLDPMHHGVLWQTHCHVQALKSPAAQTQTADSLRGLQDNSRNLLDVGAASPFLQSTHFRAGLLREGYNIPRGSTGVQKCYKRLADNGKNYGNIVSDSANRPVHAALASSRRPQDVVDRLASHRRKTVVLL